MIATQERKIGENIYLVTQFGAKRGRTVLFRLIKMLGPAMSGLIKGGISGIGVGAALQSFAESAREEDFDYLCDAFAECSKVKKTLTSTTGKEIVLDLSKVFDDHFRGHYGEMVLWLAFAAEVNFQNFTTEIGTAGIDLFGGKPAEDQKSE